jgi:hypothetical protein
MDKLYLTGQDLGRAFNSRSGCVNAMQLNGFETKRPNLKLKIRTKQLLHSLLFPEETFWRRVRISVRSESKL